eukprot:TRINITY_DN5751_c0_g1_i1.p1 TRINITY_DN5751_c0_g1~~TRINITY_DN5751_c0_g1_i1.p1  ORF type:complete len:333 (+),score=53.78 TRINITY_DN5751_c0_g1_i1:242-1240(+)
MPMSVMASRHLPMVLLIIMGYLFFSLLKPNREQGDGHLKQNGPTMYTYKVVAIHRHSRGSFTQGLLFDPADKGQLLESTGLYREGMVQRVDLESGAIIDQTPLDDREFGEGLVLWKGLLLQLLWKSGEGHVYNASSLKRIGKLVHPYRDGWGLTTSPLGDEDTLVMTDSGHHLLYVKPTLSPNGRDVDLKQSRRVVVRDGAKIVTMVNELEQVGNQIYANIFGRDCIAIISADGVVTGWVMLQSILTEPVRNQREHEILNGIAYDPGRPSRLFVTGKQWPTLYEIELVETAQFLHADVQRACIPTRNIFTGWVQPAMVSPIDSRRSEPHSFK